MKSYKVFISYAREDKNQKERLISELRALEKIGLIETWHDSRLLGGTKFTPEIAKKIDESDIIMPMVSRSFLESDYCKNELDWAKDRISRGQCMVVPVLLEDASGWRQLPAGNSYLGDIQVLPTDGVPLVLANPQDVWQDILRGMTDVVVAASGESPNLKDVNGRILSSVGIFLMDSIAHFFDLDAWHHHYTGYDRDAEAGLKGEVVVDREANSLVFTGHTDDYEEPRTTGTLTYDSHVHRFRYSVTHPAPVEQYHFDLTIPTVGGVVVKAVRFDPKALEVSPEMTLSDFLKFLRRVFRKQLATSLNKPRTGKKSGTKKD